MRDASARAETTDPVTASSVESQSTTEQMRVVVTVRQGKCPGCGVLLVAAKSWTVFRCGKCGEIASVR